MSPLFVVIDDIQFPEMTPGSLMPGVDKAFGYAAYVIERAGMETLIAQLTKAKKDLGLDSRDPIKAVMDQEIARGYHERHGSGEGGRRFAIARGNARQIGFDLLQGLSACGGTVVASFGWPYSSTPDRGDLLQWAFEDLLQRVAFVVKDKGVSPASTVVMADRCGPEEQARMLRSFAEGAHRGLTTGGQNYFAGPLETHGVLPALLFGSTPDAAPLQIGDFVARACRDFVAWCNNPRKFPHLFMPIIKCLHRSASGQVDRYGFLIHPRVAFQVDQKISELLAEQERQATS